MPVTKNDNFNEAKMKLNRLNKLKDLGINPYPANSKRTHKNIDIIQDFETLSQNKEIVFCVGRIRLIREHGGSTFIDIEDETTKIQTYFKKNNLNSVYKLVKLLDLGDFIEIKGIPFKTQKGEMTIEVQDFHILSKSLRPLPDKWHGLKDHEERYRRRYVDLIMNKETKDLFKQQSQFIQEIRNFYLEKDFIEVKTPVLENVPGGAEADPFITHHNSLDIDLYLRISLELHLKRLMVGGYEKIFEIGPVFRNEGLSTQHLQEFTMVESYEAYQSYEHLIEFIQELYSTIIKNTFGTYSLKYKDQQLNFEPNWEVIDYYELVEKYSGIDLRDFTDVDSLKVAIREKNIKIKFEKHAGIGRVIDQLYKKVARPHILQPALLINHPLAISPLSKVKEDDPNRVERIQVLIAGAEVGNAFSELNDPIDQKNRFLQQSQLREAGDSEAQMMDLDYVEALEYGMPPAAGFGVGIERFFSICANLESIRDAVFFPTMKPKEGPSHSDKFENAIVKELKYDLSKDIREKALDLIDKNTSEELKVHLLATEVAMKSLADKFGGDSLAWGIAGLLHDIDWELIDKVPEKHCGNEFNNLVEGIGIPNELIEDIKSHHSFYEIEKNSMIRKCLFAVDELTGFIIAVTKVRPSKKINDVKVSSITKKLKDKSFAAAVDRDNIKTCETELSIPLNEFIEITLAAMKSIDKELGL